MKVKKLIKLIENDGWFQVAQVGSENSDGQSPVSEVGSCSYAKRKSNDKPSGKNFQESHRQFKHKTKPGRVTIAGKLSKDMPIGTLNSVLKQAGIKEF